MKQLSEEGAKDIIVLLGGNIPKKDFDNLKQLGVSGIFQTGSQFDDIVKFIDKQQGGENE
jgi:methylmalonyl-CoA mutase C-terminal domain/subunit